MLVKIRNLTTNFEVLGDGKNIMILHGWQDSLKSWYEIQNLLSKHFRVFTIDLPGFGKTEKPKGTWGIENYSEFLKSFIKELEIKDSVLIGHSFGGKVAAFFTSQNPSSVNKLILVSATGVESKSFQTKVKIIIYKFGKIVLKTLGLSKSKLAHDFMTRIGSRDYKEAKQLRNTFVKVVNQSIKDKLVKIKVPTLIIWGDKDKELPFKLSKKFESLITNSYIKIAWDTGHNPQIEKPPDLAQIISDFINERI
jgi:pimeloyl-ACP methyl ester carboxylesterase